MRLIKISILVLLTILFSSCETPPSWADDMGSCLDEDEISLLIVGLKRFEKVLEEKTPGETRTQRYKNYLTKVSKESLVNEFYHELLIKETTKKMLYTDFYGELWQRSSQWILNDGKGTGVFLINGHEDIPQCLAKTSGNNWLIKKTEKLKSSSFPLPSDLATEMLESFSDKEYENPQLRMFIALSLCYTQSVAYYIKKDDH